nr:myosin-6-like [Procambarus clarkii]
MSGDSNPQPLFGRITDQVAALPKSEGTIRHRVIECKICMEKENSESEQTSSGSCSTTQSLAELKKQTTIPQTSQANQPTCLSTDLQPPNQSVHQLVYNHPFSSQNQQKQTIAHLNKKCNECENEKSELENKCGYQDATITDLNTNVRDLELTIVQLTKKLGDQENEIENLKKENSTLQDNQMKLRIQYDDEKKQYETEYAFMLDEKDRQFQHIFEDKDKQIKDLADEKEKLTDLINSNNTSISRQQQEELNRKINTNLMSLKEYQLKLATCENDIRIQKMQFLECQEALQKCNYDKQSDQEEYNNLLVSQNHYVQECQQKLLDCENSKKIKYDEYNTLVKNINEANKYNIETLERLYTKPTLSNSDIIHCFSSIFPLNDDNESKATGKSQIEAIINKFIHQ